MESAAFEVPVALCMGWGQTWGHLCQIKSPPMGKSKDRGSTGGREPEKEKREEAEKETNL